MTLVKIWLHCLSLIQKGFFKIIYGRKFNVKSGTTWRKRMSFMIGTTGYVQIGSNCFFNNGCSINSLDKIIIGDRCLFGENVCIYDHNHRFSKNIPIKEQGYTKKEIQIGNDCWIGSGVTILKGVHIGNKVIISAGCVITANIPDNTLVKLNQNLVLNSINGGLNA